jgi:hypothetical protein
MPSRLRILPLLVGLAGTGWLSGCHRRSDPADRASAQRSLDDLTNQFGRLKAQFRDLRRQVETVPPDLPGFAEVRARFYAVEEARGVTELKATLLRGRLDSTTAPGQPEQLRQIAKELAETHDEIRQIDELHATLQRQIRALLARAPARREIEAVTAAHP